MTAPAPTDWLTPDEVLAIHETVVAASDVTEPGVRDRGDVAYAVEAAREGPFGQEPGSLHDCAGQLVRLLVANHPFVDGNKRTALASAVAVYGLHDRRLDYDRGLKALLKRVATDATATDAADVADHLRDASRALDGENPQAPGESREAAVRRLVRRDMREHADIYAELARE